MKEVRFEVVWYINPSEFIIKYFYTKKSALEFYEKHKNDEDKFRWSITHRNADWEVIEDIVY